MRYFYWWDRFDFANRSYGNNRTNATDYSYFQELASFENMRDKVQVTAERMLSITDPETGYRGEGQSIDLLN